MEGNMTDKEINGMLDEIERLKNENELVKRMYAKVCENKCESDAENVQLKEQLAERRNQ